MVQAILLFLFIPLCTAAMCFVKLPCSAKPTPHVEHKWVLFVFQRCRLNDNAPWFSFMCFFNLSIVGSSRRHSGHVRWNFLCSTSSFKFEKVAPQLQWENGENKKITLPKSDTRKSKIQKIADLTVFSMSSQWAEVIWYLLSNTPDTTTWLVRICLLSFLWHREAWKR